MMSPDRRRFFGRRREQVVVRETATVAQSILAAELRATDPYRFVATESPDIFPLHDLIRNPVSTIEQVEAALRHTRTTRAHQTGSGISLPEFVDIDDIILPHTVVEKTEKDRYRLGLGRTGTDHVLHHALELQREGYQLNPPFDALQAELIHGRYYILNGVYRAAALRALRVPFAPMYVHGEHH